VDIRVEKFTVSKVSLLFRVHDTGIGIEKAAQETIFQAFSQADGSSTRKYGGTGLGLTISAQLVDLMDGRIWVESERGKGSTFFFTSEFELPRPEERTSLGLAALESSLSKPPEKLHRSLHILVVEDNAVNRKVVTRLLERQGHRITIATNGVEALHALETFHWGFDLVLMDVQMPEMDGLEATTELRKRERIRGTFRMPVVALTAHALERDRERCFAAGVDAYLSKPIRMDDLTNVIGDLTSRERLVVPE
jgi:CheY-like chemotaxis protein